MGAQKFDRVHKGVKQGGLIAAAFSTVITLTLLFFAAIAALIYVAISRLVGELIGLA